MNSKKLIPEREKRREWEKNYRKSPEGKKKRTKTQWKQRGLDMNNFEEVYEKYLQATKCELCNVEFIDKNCGKQKCMDHCHETGKFRNILCRNCNVNVIPHIKNILDIKD